ncbi:MAG TPA: hypothetical protein VHL59_19520 [Thermoanaerobaculia bacterium]|nr:hypothetical protein [Thermoanaerobaculia bacterium]
MMKHISLIAVLLAAVTAHAQMGRDSAETIRITLSGTCSPAGPIFFVLNGDESKALPIELESMPWTGTWPHRFPLSTARASLRLGDARTECIPAKRHVEDGVVMAWFDFSCREYAVRDISVRTEPRVDSSYIRVLSHDCQEDGRFRQTQTIVDVMPEESLRLQLGRSRPDRNSAGLLLNDRAVTRRLAKNGTARLRTSDVLAIFEQHRAAAKGGAPPSLSSNAFACDKDRLTAEGLESVTIRVVK